MLKTTKRIKTTISTTTSTTTTTEIATTTPIDIDICQFMNCQNSKFKNFNNDFKAFAIIKIV